MTSPQSGPAAANPLHNDNRMKLGTFGTNGGGIAMTRAPEAAEVSWKKVISAARKADDYGFEAIVPFARWKGYVPDNPMHRTGVVFDPYAWAAGQAQATQHSAVFTTSHVPTMHPLVAAKQCATIDHISGGRFALNIVAGWNKPELEMFGVPMQEHDDRYDQAAEWVEIVRRLWTEQEAFDYEGRYYKLESAISLPHPLQQPMPPLMNAGTSRKGQHFAAKYADLAFVILTATDPADIRRQTDSYRELAHREYGRALQVWSYAFVVQRETQREADAFLHYYTVEYGDEAAVDGWSHLQGVHTHMLPPEQMHLLRNRFKAGAGGWPLVGTAGHITGQLEMLADAGIDGLLLGWVDFDDGLDRFASGVMPLLRQAGLRR